MFLFMTSLHENSPPDISEDLIIRIAKEDTEALRELYEKTHKAVYGFAYSILKDPTYAQDVLQDTFVKIYSSACIYKKQGKPMAWILTIAKNLCLMQLRKNKKVVPMDISEAESVLPTTEFTTQSDDKYILQNALLKLSDEDREIVVLHVVSGLKHREIAEFLDMKLTNVLSKYHRAIKKLRTILEEGQHE